MNKITIVIPNYNGEKYIPQCLKALDRQEMKDFKVIIVDNGSDDNSVATAKSCPHSFAMDIIELNSNYGFSKAVNQGIMASESEYVILLNNDTSVERHFTQELVARLEGQEDIFSAQALMLNYSDRRLVDSAGDWLCVLGWAFSRGKDKKASGYDRECDIFSSCAGAAIYRRSVFDEIGLFDEDFFAYLEDVDIGYRARLYGYRNVYAPKAKVLHVGSGASGSRHNAFKVSLSARNSILVMYKNFAVWQMIINFLPVMAGIAVKTVFFAKKRLAGEYIKGIVSAISKAREVERVKVPEGKGGNYAVMEKELLVNALRRIGFDPAR